MESEGVKDSYSVGERVFAKLTGFPYWPARVTKKGPTAEEYRVVFFGTNDYANVKAGSMRQYTDETVKKYSLVGLKSSDKKLAAQYKRALEKCAANTFQAGQVNGKSRPRSRNDLKGNPSSSGGGSTRSFSRSGRKLNPRFFMKEYLQASITSNTCPTIVNTAFPKLTAGSSGVGKRKSSSDQVEEEEPLREERTNEEITLDSDDDSSDNSSDEPQLLQIKPPPKAMKSLAHRSSAQAPALLSRKRVTVMPVQEKPGSSCLKGSEVTKKIKTEDDSDDPATPGDLNLKVLKDQKDCDVFFVVGREKEKIGAHKIILKQRSKYFQARLSGRLANKSKHNGEVVEIVLEEEEPAIFHSFLEHVYGYEFRASPVEAVKLLSMAKLYVVRSLVESCEELLAKPLQPDDLLQVFVTARKFELSNVMDKAGKTMADYFTELTKSPSFESADEATLMYLLERDDLNVKESTLFSILVCWADKQRGKSAELLKPGRNAFLKKLLPLVRFPTMNAREFAEVVALTNILPVATERNLFLYLNVHEDRRPSVINRLIFSAVPRKNDLVHVELYAKHPRPGTWTYPNIALQNRSNVRDTLQFKFAFESSPPRHQNVQIVSVVLERPKYAEPLFQNSSEVSGMNLLIRVAVSLSEADTWDGRPNWTSEEVVADIGNGPAVLTLDKPRLILSGKFYKITTRFLSNVYTVPDVVHDGGPDQDWLNEHFDFFSSTLLQRMISVPVKAGFYVELYFMGGGAGSIAGANAAKATALSSRLHLIRSIQVTEV